MRRRRGFRPTHLSITGAVGRRGGPGLGGGAYGTLQREASAAHRPDWWAAVTDRTWRGPVRKGALKVDPQGRDVRRAELRERAAAGGKLRPAPGGALRCAVCSPVLESKSDPPVPPSGHRGLPDAFSPRGSAVTGSHAQRPGVGTSNGRASFALAGRACLETAREVRLQRKKKSCLAANLPEGYGKRNRRDPGAAARCNTPTCGFIAELSTSRLPGGPKRLPGAVPPGLGGARGALTSRP